MRAGEDFMMSGSWDRIARAMENKSILITGGTGFIGRALVNVLEPHTRSIVVLDTAAATFDSPNVEVILGDVRDDQLVHQLVERCDLVIHLAAVVGVSTYMEQPLNVLSVGLSGTLNVAQACVKFDVPLLFSSSSEVLGKTRSVSSEDADCIYGSPSQTRWSYALSKAVGEVVLHSFDSASLSFSIVRFFNVYGPGMDGTSRGRVVGRFVEAMKRKEPLRVHGEGNAIRSFCYLDDVLEAVTILAGGLLNDNREIIGETFHIGRDEPVTMMELARTMARLGEHQPGIVQEDPYEVYGKRFEAINYRVPDVSKLKQVTGFEAKTSLEEGMKVTLQREGLLAQDPQGKPSDPIPWVRPRFHPSNSLLTSIESTLRGGHVTNGGPAIEELEHSVSTILETPHVIAVTNGSMALRIASEALGPISKAQKRPSAVLPSFTFIATANALRHAGFELIYCDVDPGTWTMDPAHLKRILHSNPDVAVIVPVNSFGFAPDLDEICRFATSSGARVIYDAAHGIGTKIRGMSATPAADVRCLSLHATKLVPGVEGGLIALFDEELASTCRQLREHGLASNLKESIAGFNGRMDNIRALVASEELKKLDDIMRSRSQVSQRLRSHIASLGKEKIINQVVPPEVSSCSTNLVVRIPAAEERGLDFVVDFFNSRDIGSRRYFWPPLHEMSAFHSDDLLPETERLGRSVLSLPLHTEMSEQWLTRIESALTDLAEIC